MTRRRQMQEGSERSERARLREIDKANKNKYMAEHGMEPITPPSVGNPPEKRGTTLKDRLKRSE